MKPIAVLTLSFLMLCATAPESALCLVARVLADDQAASSPAQKPIAVRHCYIKAVKTARLATDRPGVLSVVEPNEGDTVREGHVIAKLQDEVPQANLEVAKLTAENDIEVRYAQKLNEVDAAEYEKAVAANRQARNAVPEIELRRKKLDEEKSRLQIEKAKHEMDINAAKARQAEAELRTYWIRAPFTGTVSRVERHPGEAVKQGDSVLEIVNTDMVQVHGYVTEQEVWRVKLGAPVAVQLSLEDVELEVEKRVFYGRIGFIDVVADKATGETRVWAEIANPANVLRPGLKAKMTIYPPSVPGTASDGPQGSRSPLNDPANRPPRRVGALFQTPARISTP